MIETINKWIDEAEKIDLMLVIGTAASVYPAAGYILKAREKGARIAVINMDSTELGAARSLREKDFMFVGDSGVVVPYILKGVIGELDPNIIEPA
jgi:NAD-dependent SIR2 family protein deacetylase